MWSLLDSALKAVKYKPKDVDIDNFGFKLHYKFTFIFLFVTAALLWSTDAFGKKIECSHSRAEDNRETNKRLDHVINTYCYTLGLFTVPRHHNLNATNREVKYAGVGPIISAEETTRKLGWYQWVYYVLLLQALSFYVPFLIWKNMENKTIFHFVHGFKRAKFLTKDERKKAVEQVNQNMRYRLRVNGTWAFGLLIGEVLNFANVILQWCLTNWFLGGLFSNLGSAHQIESQDFHPLDIIFPKMAKCTYNKFGHSGSLENIDIVCVLTYNIVYEKIYLFLWYWYILLMTTSAMALIHRLLSWALHRYNLQYFNQISSRAEPGDLCLLKESLNYTEWLFLEYLCGNLDDEVVSDLVTNLADNIRAHVIYTYYPQANLRHERGKYVLNDFGDQKKTREKMIVAGLEVSDSESSKSVEVE